MSMNTVRRVAIRAAVAATLVATVAWIAPPALSAPPALTGEALAVKKVLEQKFPGTEINHVAKSGYLGLYEVMLDDKLVYTDAKANYVVVGTIYDTNTKQNLTEARSRKLNRVSVDKLPMDLAFKRVKGNGERKLVIFSDADCPFCHRLEDELKAVDNVTIYTFLFPIDQLHPDAARKSKRIWCSGDPEKAWNEFFANGAVPENQADCGDPVARTQALGASLKISATPTLVFEDGSLVPGALPAAQIEQELANARVEAKKLAASGTAQTK
jgi:thiol:disulfide interchange protein DsbC